MSKNAAGVDPEIEDVNVNKDLCELCNGPLIVKMTVKDEVFYICDDCEYIQ